MLLLSAFPALVPAVHAARPQASVSQSTSPAPAALGREAIALLSRLASDPDPEVRAAVAASWGGLGSRAAIPLLKRSLQDAQPDVRIAAAVSLRILGDVQGLTALIDEMKAVRTVASATPAEELRLMARDAARARATLRLGEAGGETAREALQAALADPAGEVRDAAAVALGRLGLVSAGQFLEALKDPDETVRASGARSLGLIGREGLESLKKALATDVSVAVRTEAAAALGSFKGDPSSASQLASALKDKNGRVRLAALRALARREEPESTASLRELLAKSPAPEPALIATAALSARGEETDLNLPELTLGQQDPELKALAVAALAASKRPQSTGLLVRVMREDPAALVRVQAAVAIVARLRRVESSR
ncbi:MAG TPA: hypothetical protein DCZ01_05575 [Elusimicrobia bacterium]|nr:MAG: hypothetical protein A2X37_11455 [Elusimicrobia bacterium GWA2_66_18]OGR74500.1 MAG: hypothetical protein A2X40_11845 [Elusimicrobia bacterium GWC2_65_9]HAZ07991.1 hypothetical protein [Elusimicrobiota bacterium]